MTKGHWTSILTAIGSIGSLLTGNASIQDPHVLMGVAGVVISVITALVSPSITDASNGSIARKP